jgi:hypothetical protein
LFEYWRTHLVNGAAAPMRVVEERNIVISSNTYTGEVDLGLSEILKNFYSFTRLYS